MRYATDQIVMDEAGSGRRILVVDSDPKTCRRLAEQLRLYAGYEVDTTKDAATTLELARKRHYDTFLIDVLLPDIDGRELCRTLRRHDCRAPIILLSTSGSDADMILGFNAGADDYVTKPYSVAVLLARLQARLRRYDDAVVVIGPYFFHPLRRLLTEIGGHRKVRLTEKEVSILKYFHHNSDRVVDRISMMRDVWDYCSAIETHTVQTHIYRLRRKIEPNPAEPRIIVTIAGKGYRLATDWQIDASVYSANADTNPPCRPFRRATRTGAADHADPMGKVLPRPCGSQPRPRGNEGGRQDRQ